MRSTLLACLLLGFLNVAAAEVSVRDDEGATVRLARPAQRIVTLAPHLSETLYAAGAGEKLVGVRTSYELALMERDARIAWCESVVSRAERAVFAPTGAAANM